jgi:hypothetical protein
LSFGWRFGSIQDGTIQKEMKLTKKRSPGNPGAEGMASLCASQTGKPSIHA